MRARECTKSRDTLTSTNIKLKSSCQIIDREIGGNTLCEREIWRKISAGLINTYNSVVSNERVYTKLKRYINSGESKIKEQSPTYWLATVQALYIE